MKLFVEGKLSIEGKEGERKTVTAILMDGKSVAAVTKQTLKEEAEYMKKVGVEPKIATILVGDDAPSKVYLASKHKAAEEIGIRSENHTLSGIAKRGGAGRPHRLSERRPFGNGILLQLPLPQHLDGRRMIETDLVREGRRRPHLREHGPARSTARRA